MMTTLAQNLVVTLLVGGCTVYALWTLMPSAARRALATCALRLPLPTILATPLRRAAQPAHGCGCDGCGRADAGAATRTTTQRVTFHPRQRR